MTNHPELPAIPPCPFDGGACHVGTVKYDARTVRAQKWPQETFYFVSCEVCGASNVGLVGHDTPERAIEKWSRRTPAPSQEGERRPVVCGRGGCVLGYEKEQRETPTICDARSIREREEGKEWSDVEIAARLADGRIHPAQCPAMQFNATEFQGVYAPEDCNCGMKQVADAFARLRYANASLRVQLDDSVTQAVIKASAAILRRHLNSEAKC